MKKNVHYLVIVLIITISLPLYSQKTIDFDQISGGNNYTSPLDITEEGETFVFAITGGEPAYGFSSNASFPGELTLGDYAGNTIKITITHKNGYDFDFSSIDLLKSLGTENWSIKGYKDGSQVDGSPQNVTGNSSTYTNFAVNFLQVDEVTIEENPVVLSGFTVWCDKFVVDNITDGSLPVELVSLSASQQSNSVTLQWATESEVDNLGFILERCQDDDNWQQIASYHTHPELAGQGTTSAQHSYSFRDDPIALGETYTYRLSETDISGAISFLEDVTVQTTVIPASTALSAAYPNPFNPSTMLDYQLEKDSNVSIEVFDIQGRLINTLYQGQQAAGMYQVQWNGTDSNGNRTASGTYLVKMQTDSGTYVNKILLIK